MPLVNCIICFCQPCFAFELELFYSWSLWYMFLRGPDGLDICLFLIRVNLETTTGHTLLVLFQIKFQHHNFVEDEKWMKGCALKKWESTLNFVFMPMDLMWNLSWKLLAKYLILWAILPVSLNWIPCSYGSDHIVLLWSHFSGKFKHLSYADQYPTPTSTLICRRVLPPGISIISQNHITSYEFFFKYYFSSIPIFPRVLSC